MLFFLFLFIVLALVLLLVLTVLFQTAGKWKMECSWWWNVLGGAYRSCTCCRVCPMLCIVATMRYQLLLLCCAVVALLLLL